MVMRLEREKNFFAWFVCRRRLGIDVQLPFHPRFNTNHSLIQIDPYLNVDAGTMSPFEHGEVFVLDDGSETDLVCMHMCVGSAGGCLRVCVWMGGGVYERVCVCTVKVLDDGSETDLVRWRQMPFPV